MKGEGMPGVVLPVVVDTLPGRDMRASYIEEKTYKSPGTNKRLYLSSAAHIEKLKILLY